MCKTKLLLFFNPYFLLLTFFIHTQVGQCVGVTPYIYSMSTYVEYVAVIRAFLLHKARYSVRSETDAKNYFSVTWSEKNHFYANRFTLTKRSQRRYFDAY